MSSQKKDTAQVLKMRKKVQHLQKLGILHPKRSAEPLGLLAEVESAVLHGGCLVDEERDAVASVQNFLYVVDHNGVYLQEWERAEEMM